jgi:DNA-binding NtrC family response regulator
MKKGKPKTRLIILDDDKTVCEVLEMRIRRACPSVEAVAIQEPVAVPGFDIYVIDNNFGGRQEGIRLAEAIAGVSPGAAVLMLSSLLEVELLKKAIGLKCAGAFDKRNPADMAMLIDTVNRLARDLPAAGGTRRTGIVSELAALIREWNERMADEETRRKLAS